MNAITVTTGWMHCTFSGRTVRCLKSDNRMFNNIPLANERADTVVAEINVRRKAMGLDLIVLK